MEPGRRNRQKFTGVPREPRSTGYLLEGIPEIARTITLADRTCSDLKRPRRWGGRIKMWCRGRHGFDGSCRGPKACRDPPARNLVETRTANNNLALAA